MRKREGAPLLVVRPFPDRAGLQVHLADVALAVLPAGLVQGVPARVLGWTWRPDRRPDVTWTLSRNVASPKAWRGAKTRQGACAQAREKSDDSERRARQWRTHHQALREAVPVVRKGLSDRIRVQRRGPGPRFCSSAPGSGQACGAREKRVGQGRGRVSMGWKS